MRGLARNVGDGPISALSYSIYKRKALLILAYTGAKRAADASSRGRASKKWPDRPSFSKKAPPRRWRAGRTRESAPSAGPSRVRASLFRRLSAPCPSSATSIRGYRPRLGNMRA